MAPLKVNGRYTTNGNQDYIKKKGGGGAGLSANEREYSHYFKQRVTSMESKQSAFDYGHVTSRRFPGIESPTYFDKYNGSRIVKREIDVQDTMKSDFGMYASCIKSITMSGPDSILDAIIDDVNKNTGAVHIFTNSVRKIANVTADTEIYEDDTGAETGLTMFAPNYYEWFPESKWNTPNGLFVYIVTTRSMHPHYERFFPHFVYIIQPEPSELYLPYGSVGLTRMAALTTAKAMGLNDAFFLDDTVFDLKAPSTTANLSPTEIVRTLQSLRTLAVGPNVGYVGLCTGAFLGSAEWETSAISNGFFTDEIRNGVKVRVFSSRPKEEALQTTTDFGSLSFVNQHRPNFIVVNVKNIRDFKLNYNPVHTIGEDIFFTGRIVCKGLNILQANVRFIRPGDSRRPKTCSADGVCEIQSWLKTQSEEDALSRKDVDVVFSDFHMYNGRLLFLTRQGVIGGAGVYGPVRVMSEHAYMPYATLLKKALPNASPACVSRYTGDLKGEHDKLYYTHTNRLIYFANSNGGENTKQILSKPIKCNTQACNDGALQTNFGLASYEDGMLLQSTGMYKYIKDYEYIQSSIDHHMFRMYKTSPSSGPSSMRNVVKSPFYGEPPQNHLRTSGVEGSVPTVSMRYDLVTETWTTLLDTFLSWSKIESCLNNTRTVMNPLPMNSTSRVRELRYVLLVYFSTVVRLLRIDQLQRMHGQDARIIAILFSFGNLEHMCDELKTTYGALFGKVENQSMILDVDVTGVISRLNELVMEQLHRLSQQSAGQARPPFLKVPVWISTNTKVDVVSKKRTIVKKTVYRNSKTGVLRVRKMVTNKTTGSRKATYVRF